MPRLPSLSLVFFFGVQQAVGAADFPAELSALRLRQWLYLIVFALAIYLGANLAQQLAIRRLGPTTVAALMPTRLLSSVGGSYAVLDEGIASPIEAGGLLLVAATASAYLGYQLRTATRARAAADAARAADAAPDMRPVAEPCAELAADLKHDSSTISTR